MDRSKNIEGEREYIYCPSYGSLFFALHRRQKGIDIKIITHNECIRKFCEDFNIAVYYFNYPRPLKLFIPMTHIFFKRSLDKFIETSGFTKSDKLFILDNAFEIFGFYIAQQYSKIGIVHFHLLGREFPIFFPRKKIDALYFIFLIQSKIFRYFWDIDLIIRNTHGKPTFGIDENFMKKNHISYFIPDKELIELKFDVVKKFSIPMKHYQILIATDGGMKGIVNEDTLSDIYMKISSNVSSLIVKSHPRIKLGLDENSYELSLNKFEHISECIPVELALNNVDKCVISVFSSVLPFTARIDRIKAISLLDLVEWNSIEYMEEVRNMLNKESDNKILFPKTIDELFEIIG
jgi:hypothetical protein